MTSQSKDPVEAPDAIPKEGILLVDAYQRVSGELWDHPERALKFDEHWLEILDESEKIYKNMHDPDVYDGEVKAFFKNATNANLFLRLALEEQELVAYVRDPKFDRILRLSSKGWTEGLDVPIPDGIWSSYLPQDGAAFGPKGSLIGGELQPVFLDAKEFEKWLLNTFGEIRTEQIPVREKHSRAQVTIEEVANILWPGEPIPPTGISRERCLGQINSWLKNKKRGPVSIGALDRLTRKRRLSKFAKL